MANAFSKEEIVLFDKTLEGFNDALVMSKNVNVFSTDSTTMERTGDIIWRPEPYILKSFDGVDQSSNFKESTQLSVPATLGYYKSVPLVLTAKELRDMIQEQRLGEAAKIQLASDINRSVLDVAVLQGTLVVKRTTAASGFDDVALIEAVMNEQGIANGDRKLVLSTRDYNGMAANLASRGTMPGKVQTAYEKAFVGEVASFDTFKMDISRRLTAAAGSGITIDTRDSAVNYYIPAATSTAATGERSNVDNRYQTVTVSATTNVAAGDCFTIAALDSVHHITKQDTGQLKTFRVISVDSGTTMTISPPIITNQVANDASAQYQNCVINTKASNSAIVFLNTATVAANPFWHKDAIELLPGRFVLPADSGVAVMRGTTDNGIEITMEKFVDINTNKIKYRWDVFYGVAMVQPEMAGIILFSQS